MDSSERMLLNLQGRHIVQWLRTLCATAPCWCPCVSRLGLDAKGAARSEASRCPMSRCSQMQILCYSSQQCHLQTPQMTAPYILPTSILRDLPFAWDPEATCPGDAFLGHNFLKCLERLAVTLALLCNWNSSAYRKCKVIVHTSRVTEELPRETALCIPLKWWNLWLL